jgi:putative transposase
MARIDALYLEDPCSGSHRMVDYLARDRISICRDRAQNLMHREGLQAIYQKPRTTILGAPSERFRCLVDLSQITAVDQVWATDITYIPIQKGFLYLVAIVDLFSRHVLSWKLSNSLDAEFCLKALEMALGGCRKPEVFHSDQGCQFTSSVFVARLQAEEIKISRSGRKRCVEVLMRDHIPQEQARLQLLQPLERFPCRQELPADDIKPVLPVFAVEERWIHQQGLGLALDPLQRLA